MLLYMLHTILYFSMLGMVAILLLIGLKFEAKHYIQSKGDKPTNPPKRK